MKRRNEHICSRRIIKPTWKLTPVSTPFNKCYHDRCSFLSNKASRFVNFDYVLHSTIDIPLTIAVKFTPPTIIKEITKMRRRSWFPCSVTTWPAEPRREEDTYWFTLLAPWSRLSDLWRTFVLFKYICSVTCNSAWIFSTGGSGSEWTRRGRLERG